MDAAELLDWEMVHGSDTDSTTDSILSSSVIDNGVILSDHFSVETTDPSLLVRVGSSSGLSDDVGVGNDILSGSKVSGDGGEVAELVGGVEDASKCLSESDHIDMSLSDSVGNEIVSGESEVVKGEEEIVADDRVVVSAEESRGSGGDIVNFRGEGKRRETVVWWKMPFVLLKYSAFRIGPVWSVSIAAAVMGFVLLGRRLYNMKKKAQRFRLKVTIDEKKVSRVMSQAARLNEAFTEVRRVPVIRPALASPAAWPVLSLR